MDSLAVPQKLRWNTARRRVLGGALLFCVACFAISRWVLWPVRISGDSMIPTYEDGQPDYINKLAYWSEAPQRGDVVGVRMGRDDFYIKRIVGLPGERIEFKRERVIVNGRALVEPYAVRPLLWRLPPVQLRAGEYFVMGDNRTTSMLGAVTKDHIIGKALF
jgi:signal peptidase I